MQTIQWEDITQHIREASKGLKLLQVLSLENFNLEETMQANEINDPKTDLKATVPPTSPLPTFAHLLSRVPDANTLSLGNSTWIYDTLLGYQMLSLNGISLTQTVYTLPYLLEPSRITKDDSGSPQAVAALVNSIITFGHDAHENYINRSCRLKDEDIQHSTYTFPAPKFSHDQVVEQLLRVQKLLEQKRQANKISSKTPNQYDALISRVKLRRFLHLFMKALSTNSIDKIAKEVESCRKRFEDILKYKQFAVPREDVLGGDFVKSIRAHLTPKQVATPTIEETLKTIQNIFSQLMLFYPFPQQYSQVLCRFDRLWEHPLNSFAKAFLITQTGRNGDDCLYMNKQLTDLMFQDIVDWTGLKQNSRPKIQDFLSKTQSIFAEIIFRSMSNKPRWHWEMSKLYREYSYVVALGNQLDATLNQGKKEMVIGSWIYYIGLDMMLKQIHALFEIELCYLYEYPFLLHYLEQLCGITDKNCALFLKKFDKSYIQAFQDKSLNAKIKKKVSSNARRMFADAVFIQGLYLYYSALNRLVAVFGHSGAFPDLHTEKSRQTFETRFKMFKHVFFVKQPDFQEFLKEYQDFTSPDALANTLATASEYLKQARNVFQSLTTLEPETDIRQNRRKEAELLVTLCVKTSVQAMKFSMNKQKVKGFKWVKSNHCYPQMDF